MKMRRTPAGVLGSSSIIQRRRQCAGGSDDRSTFLLGHGTQGDPAAGITKHSSNPFSVLAMVRVEKARLSIRGDMKHQDGPFALGGMSESNPAYGCSRHERVEHRIQANRARGAATVQRNPRLISRGSVENGDGQRTAAFSRKPGKTNRNTGKECAIPQLERIVKFGYSHRPLVQPSRSLAAQPAA